MRRVSINKFIEDPLENCTEHFNFYDWFCKDSSLEKRMLSVVPKLKFLVKQGVLNGDTNYIWLKNNCPLDGNLYDDIRISTLKGDEFIGGICPKSGFNSDVNKCNIWYFDEAVNVQTLEFLNWSTFKKEVKNNQELREILIENWQ